MTKGERLRKLREDNGYSQTDAAERIGVSKQTLYKYEKDIITNIPSDIIEKIAVVYGSTPAYIFGWKNSNGKNQSESGMMPKSDFTIDEMYDAIQLFKAYTNANPDIRSAVDLLLHKNQVQAEIPHLKVPKPAVSLPRLKKDTEK